MKVQSAERMLVLAAGCLSIVAAARWRAAVPPTTGGVIPIPAIARTLDVASDDAVANAAALTVDNDPFRLSNTAPDVRYDPATDGVAAKGPAMPAMISHPTLVLKGIVGGPPWQAIIDGIPGQPSGTIAKQGDVFDKLVVRAVTPDSVRITGPDTSWVLSFQSSARRP